MYNFEVGQDVIVVNSNPQNRKPYPGKIIKRGRKYFKVELFRRVYDMEIGTNAIISQAGYTPHEFVYPSIEAYEEYKNRQNRLKIISNAAQYFRYYDLPDSDLEILERILKIESSANPT